MVFKEKNDYHTEIPARTAATDGGRCLRFSVGFPLLSGTVDGTVANRDSTSLRREEQWQQGKRMFSTLRSAPLPTHRYMGFLSCRSFACDDKTKIIWTPCVLWYNSNRIRVLISSSHSRVPHGSTCLPSEPNAHTDAWWIGFSFLLLCRDSVFCFLQSCFSYFDQPRRLHFS
ncbi:hypothetical protein NC651_039960 [Populus alba x Populus x berolinensis]|nr:hypothetical protein NC651_039960 [Populus alba x Populus x berolinensis]